MDPPANQKNPIDIDNWFHYFDHDGSPLFGVDTLEYQGDSFEILDPSLLPPLGEDQNQIISELGIQDFELFADFSFCGSLDDLSPLISYNDDSSDHQSQVINNEAKSTTAPAADQGGRNGGRRSRPLELEEIEKHFEMPIIVAAKKLRIGLTALKKRCRELNIKRWPYRKLKSLQSVIHNAKEFGLHDEIEMLEEHKRMTEKLPDLELTQRTKQLRQACFKASYKKRRHNSPNYPRPFHSL